MPLDNDQLLHMDRHRRRSPNLRKNAPPRLGTTKSGFRSYRRISSMPEVVGAFLSTEHCNERANRSQEVWNSPRGNLAQQRFEFAVRQLDRIEVRRILRQIAKRCPTTFDCFLDASDFVRRKFVHHHDIAAPERRNQALLHISEEHFSIHGPVDHHGCRHFIVTQGGHESNRLPCPKWHLADQSDALLPLRRTMLVLTAVSSRNTSRAGSSSPCSRIQRRPGTRIARGRRPRAAVQRLAAFFLRAMSCRSRKRQSELRLVRIRRMRSAATVSTKVRPGCSAITANICVANLSSGETLPPLLRRFQSRASAAPTLSPNSRSPPKVPQPLAATHPSPPLL